jgi:hypothetical protein
MNLRLFYSHFTLTRMPVRHPQSHMCSTKSITTYTKIGSLSRACVKLLRSADFLYLLQRGFNNP